MDLSPEHLALEVIDEVGPQGNYLTHDHTLKHFRHEFWFLGLLDRNNYDTWRRAGGRSLAEKAHQRAKEILGEHRPEPLDKTVAGAIEAILKAGEG